MRCRSTRNWRSTLLQLRHVDVQHVGLAGDGQDALVQDLLDLGAVLRRGPADEGEVGQVAGQADAAADDDVGLGARAPQPLAAVRGQIVEFHVQSVSSSLSMRWISSRSCEARS